MISGLDDDCWGIMRIIVRLCLDIWGWFVVGLDTFFMGVVGWYYSLLVMEWYIVVFPVKNISKNPKTQYIIKKPKKIWKNYTKNQFPKLTGNFDKLILLLCLVVFILRWVLLLLVLLLYVVLVYVVWVLIIRGCDWRGYR